MGDTLAGRRIVVPETRELDVFARMLEQHGAITIRCPMVAINDVADAAPVVAWLGRFTSDPPNDLILMTGEGLGRLVGFARRAGLEEAFMAALARVRKITRGPKPVRRLRALGLRPDLAAEPPTTAGIIIALSGEDLAGRKIAIQLYPDNPNIELIEFLRGAGASPDPVLCYVYGSEAEDRRVIEVIEEMAAGRVDRVHQLATGPTLATSGEVKSVRRDAAARFRAHEDRCRRAGRCPRDRRGRRTCQHLAIRQFPHEADGERDRSRLELSRAPSTSKNRSG
jgi:uroporphyrinogen-III synthase